MSIRFECIGCGKRIVVHDRFEGRNVRCPSCSCQSTVPKVTPQVEPQPEETDEPPNVQAEEQPATLPSLDLLSSSSSQDEETAGVDVVHVAAEKPNGKRRSRSIRDDDDHEEEDLEWDITPMVDVAFLLLIFFMLTASFSIQKVIRTSPPQSEQPSSNAVQVQVDDKVENLIVQVDEFNAYTVVSADGQTNEASSRQELITILRDIRSQSGEQLPRIVIQAHVDSFHGAVVSCMDAAREAEFTSFQMFAVESFD